jgi:hypothetical protein
MNARQWFNRGLEALAVAVRARTAGERQSYNRSAVDSFFAAASLGHAGAFLRLGFHYRDGEFGVARARPDLAEHWFRLAAAQTSAGMYELGLFLLHTRRKVEGLTWLRKALSRGEGAAAYELGKEVEPTSKARALQLFLRGAKLGDPYAAMAAARLLEDRGAKEEILRAAALYRFAARKQGRDAAGDLARIQRKLDHLRWQARQAAQKQPTSRRPPAR